ncbi:MAG: lipopolysaccharide heptosyltransferase I [Mariprofundus sp.]
MKILIVKLSAFGDIIHALPALDDLLARPDVTEVHWLVDERFAFVSEVFPKQVIVHRVALKGEKPFSSAWQCIRKLRAIDFDAVLDLQWLLKSALLARAVGKPAYGPDRAQLREKAAALFTQQTAFHSDEKHVVQQYRRVAAAPFNSQPKQTPPTALSYRAPHIDLKQTGIHIDENLLSRFGLCGTKYVILHAAGGWETKQLPEQTWLSIADALIDSAKTAVFSWGNDIEKVQAQRLAETCNGFALPERLNMSALCTLLQSATAVVGADTGLLHLSAALNVPTITFWGPSASWRSAPLDEMTQTERQGDLHWHIESNPSCGPCFKRSCDQFICMDAIDPESITRILHEL